MGVGEVEKCGVCGKAMQLGKGKRGKLEGEFERCVRHRTIYRPPWPTRPEEAERTRRVKGLTPEREEEMGELVIQISEEEKRTLKGMDPVEKQRFFEDVEKREKESAVERVMLPMLWVSREEEEEVDEELLVM